ncbi:protein NRT1/ PTR FAMILY 5.10-like [Triticum aestivum]|uniref:protein NRT1/ PTR FAMILY 5.10-like n=1 Tax=Triticum aestivum TaxID=4565 RepID=UPI001D019728|nr:protein NRT1/ PTR FAMILY 5.10-like [Triticum aestivum]
MCWFMDNSRAAQRTRRPPCRRRSRMSRTLLEHPRTSQTSPLHPEQVAAGGHWPVRSVRPGLGRRRSGPSNQDRHDARSGPVRTAGGRSKRRLGPARTVSTLSRYRSIILACTLYVLGYGMVTLASTLLEQSSLPAGDIHTSSGPSSLQVAFLYASLYLIALAQGADKPCALAFAADQFDPEHLKERASRSSLFNWWFFSMAAGISISVAVVSYIQENIGWGIGFGMLCTIMVCTFIVFLSGTPTYRFCVPTTDVESPFARLGRSLGTLIKSSSFPFSTNGHQDEDVVAKSEEARNMLRVLPIWAACLAYGVAYAQIMTLFNKQGRTSNVIKK